MSEIPPGREEFDDVDALYRRASARDTGGPSESVRRAVLEHAARVAAERAAAERTGVDLNATERARNTVVDISAAKRRATRPTWWRPAAFGTLAAASLAGLLIAPQFLIPRTPPQEATKAVPAPAEPAPPAVLESPPAEPAPPASEHAYSGAPAAKTSTDLAAGSTANNAPAPERNLAKTQTTPSAPRSAAAQDELKAEVAQTTVTAQRAADGQGAAADNAGAAADSAGAPVDARRARSQAASGAVASAPAAAPALQSTTPMAAARLLDPAAELRHAADLGDMPALQAALERRPVIDARDANGRTALMLAVRQGRAEAVDALLAAGADPNAADADGATPLKIALAGGQPAIVEALRRAGAK